MARDDNDIPGIAVVGAGYWGGNLVRNFAATPKASLLWVVDIDVERAHPLGSGYAGVQATATYEDALNDPAVTGIAIATPAASHADLAMAALEVGVEIATRVDMTALRKKSQRMGDLFLDLVERECDGFGLETACPLDSEKRGSQVSLRHDDGYPIMQALIANGVIGDFRAPEILRFGFTPLYLRYSDVWDAVAVLKKILETEAWRLPEFQKRQLVT